MNTRTILSIHKGFTCEYSIFLLKKSFFVWSQTVWVCDLFRFVMPLHFLGNALGIQLTCNFNHFSNRFQKHISALLNSVHCCELCSVIRYLGFECTNPLLANTNAANKAVVLFCFSADSKSQTSTPYFLVKGKTPFTYSSREKAFVRPNFEIFTKNSKSPLIMFAPVDAKFGIILRSFFNFFRPKMLSRFSKRADIQ